MNLRRATVGLRTGSGLALSARTKPAPSSTGESGVTIRTCADALAGGPAAVVLVSSRDRKDLGRRARVSGALGFIPKDQLSEESLLAVMGEGR